MRWSTRLRFWSLSAVIILVATGCQWPDESRPHERCVIPLDDLTTPVVALGEIVPETDRVDDMRWGCELWLSEPIEGFDAPEEVLVPATWWSLSSEDRSVILDRSMASTYRRGVLVCPSDLDRCPAVDGGTPRRVCRLDKMMQPSVDGGEATQVVLEDAVALGSITMTDNGPALVWFARDPSGEPVDGSAPLNLDPRVTWFRVGDEENIEVSAEHAHCRDDDCADLFRNPRQQLPTSRAVTSNGSLIVPDLCGDGSLVAVDPAGRCTPHSLDLDDEVHALDIRPDGQAGSRLLWTNGEQLLSSALDDGFRPTGEPIEVWNPTAFTRDRPSAACDMADGALRCILSWSSALPDTLPWTARVDRIRDGRVGELMWQGIGDGADFDWAGRFGVGQDLQLIGYRGSDQGVALWRHTDWGFLASPWSRTRSGTPVFDIDATQVGTGHRGPEGEWNLSRATVAVVDDRTIIVGWWSAYIPAWAGGDGTGGLELRVLRETAAGLISTPIELTGSLEEHSSYLVNPPAIAWLSGEELTSFDGRLLIAWASPGADVVTTEIYAPFLDSNSIIGDPVTFERRFDGPEVEIVDHGFPVTAIDAIATNDGFVVGVASDEGIFLSLMSADGADLDRWEQFVPDEEYMDPIDIQFLRSDTGARRIWVIIERFYWGDESFSDLHEGRLDGFVLSTFGDTLSPSELIEGLWPPDNDWTRLAMHPTFASGSEPIITWTEATIPSALISDLLDGDDAPLFYDDWFEREQNTVRMARLTYVDGTLELDPIDVEPANLTDRPPRIGNAVDVPCPEAAPFLDSQRCVLINFGSSRSADLDYWSEGFEGLESTLGGLILAAIDEGRPPLWVPIEFTSYEGHRLLPLGSWSSSQNVLVSMTLLDPWSDDDSGLWDELYFSRWGSVDIEWSDSEWLSELGITTALESFSEKWRTLTVELAPAPDDANRAGALWTRLPLESEIPGEGECYRGDGNTDASPITVDRMRQILFAEIDSTFAPTSRAVVIVDDHNSPPQSWSYYVSDAEPENNPPMSHQATDLLTPLHMTSVGALGNDQYLVAWLEPTVDWIIDPVEAAWFDVLEDTYVEYEDWEWADCIPRLDGGGFVGVVTCE